MTKAQTINYEESPRPRRRLLLIFAIVACVPIAVIAIPLVLFFGSQSVRDMTPPPSLADQLRADFNIGLPTGVKQVNAARQSSGIDPASFYELEREPSADWSELIQRLESAAKANGWDVSRSDPGAHLFHGAPAWWNVPTAPGTIHLRLLKTIAGGNGYFFIYSPESNRAFVFWFNT